MWLGRRLVIKTVAGFKRFYTPWNNTKEFRKYLVDGKFLNLTYGPFTSTVAARKKDVQSAQALVYEYFKEAKWEWEPDNPTGKYFSDVRPCQTSMMELFAKIVNA